MISLCSEIFNFDGDFTFYDHEVSGHDGLERRITRTKTLDENVYIDDMGLTAGDNDIIIQVSGMLLEKIQLLQSAFKVSTYFTLSTQTGIYRVVFKRMQVDTNGVRIDLLVVSDA